MKRISFLRRLSVIGIFLPAILLAGVWPVRSAGAAPVWADGGSPVHGVNFMVKTFLDESVCVETDVAASTTPSVYLAPCTGRANQRWTFTDGEDGSSVVVGDRGFCLKVERGAKPERLGIATCDYLTDQRFTVTPAGRIMERRSDDCLTMNTPLTGGNAIFVEECRDSLAVEQAWRLAM